MVLKSESNSFDFYGTDVAESSTEVKSLIDKAYENDSSAILGLADWFELVSFKDKADYLRAVVKDGYSRRILQDFRLQFLIKNLKSKKRKTNLMVFIMRFRILKKLNQSSTSA
jgi:hypothetical protein